MEEAALISWPIRNGNSNNIQFRADDKKLQGHCYVTPTGYTATTTISTATSTFTNHN